MKLTAITALAMLLLFSSASWARICTDSRDKYSEIPQSRYDNCTREHGCATDSSVVFGVCTHRGPAQGEDHRDFVQVKTVAGMLMVRNEHDLWLGDKKLADAKWVSIAHGVTERRSLPSVFEVNLSPIEKPAEGWADLAYFHLVDVGVTPPFISKDPLPVVGVKQGHGRNRILFERMDSGSTDNVYIMVGESRTEKDKDGNPVLRAYKYDRKTRTITKM